MKKVFFTAIAIIAFSSLSLANTISDENEVVNNQIKVVLLKQNCKDVFASTLSSCASSGIDADTAWSIADAAYGFCVFRNGGV